MVWGSLSIGSSCEGMVSAHLYQDSDDATEASLVLGTNITVTKGSPLLMGMCARTSCLDQLVPCTFPSLPKSVLYVHLAAFHCGPLGLSIQPVLFILSLYLWHIDLPSQRSTPSHARPG